MCWAISFVTDKAELAQQIVQDRFDDRLQFLIGVSNPGDVGVGIEPSIHRPAGGRGYDHARFFGDELRAKIVRVATVAGRDPPLFGKPLDERAEIGHKTVLADGEIVKLPAGAGVLIFEDADFAVGSREHAVA